MFTITINQIKWSFSSSISVIEIVRKCLPDLEKDCVAAKVNGKLIDLCDHIANDMNLDLVIRTDKQGLKIIRTSCIQLLGYAIKKIWPNAKMVIGKIIGDNFYYDVDLNYPLKKNEIKKIQDQMKLLANKNYEIKKKIVSWEKAYQVFSSLEEEHKIEILEKNLVKNKKINLYFHEEYVDFFEGPQVPKIEFCHNFLIQKASGVYWKKNQKNVMLQRIHGTVWENRKDLSSYVQKLEKIKERDHRNLNKKLDLYHIQEESPGMVFWHDSGWTLFNELKSFIRMKFKFYRYQEVQTPVLVNKILWEKTKHLENFDGKIFTTSSERNDYCLKPMNCPGHIQIFKQKLRSYKELPIKIAEFGSCYRNEFSGSLHGLMRIRNFTQDDAHIFCSKNQIQEEINNCIEETYEIYRYFGFKNILVKLSTRPEKYIGSKEEWREAEEILSSILKEKKISFQYQVGEGAFYGPKIEFSLLDSLKRVWQCGTIQLDFFLPSRLEAFYINEKNRKIPPIMIHRAILGSMERFIGIITEEFSGKYPVWLAPIQVVIMNITDRQKKYVQKIEERLSSSGIRVKVDLRNEKIGLKIRENTILGIPYLLICGDKEVKLEEISIRSRNGKNLGNYKVSDFIKLLKREDLNFNFSNLEE